MHFLMTLEHKNGNILRSTTLYYHDSGVKDLLPEIRKIKCNLTLTWKIQKCKM